MRLLNLLPLYILVLNTAASAQLAPALRPDAVIGTQRVALRTEAVPDVNPSRLTINQSKTSIQLMLLTKQRAALAAAQSAKTGAASPAAIPAGSPARALPVMAPEAALQQPGLPAAATVRPASAVAAAMPAGLSPAIPVPAPAAALLAPPEAAAPAPTAPELSEPPPPVFQTMKQAAQAQQANIKSALSNVTPVVDNPPPSRLQQVLDFVEKNRRNSLIGGSVVVLLAFLTFRRRSARTDDDEDEE